MPKQQLMMQLQRVKCVDETGGAFVERFGNDEIAMAVVGVDAVGRTALVTPFSVYAHFDDGEVKTYAPPKTLLTLDVPDDGTFPKTCAAMLLLAETDGGGFADVANKAYEKITAEVAARKPPVAAVGPIIAAIWATVGPVVTSYVQGLIKRGIDDDVFPAQTVSLDISSRDFRWGDGTKLSPEMTVEFRGHDGVYRVTYYWEIRTV